MDILNNARFIGELDMEWNEEYDIIKAQVMDMEINDLIIYACIISSDGAIDSLLVTIQ